MWNVLPVEKKMAKSVSSSYPIPPEAAAESAHADFNFRELS